MDSRLQISMDKINKPPDLTVTVLDAVRGEVVALMQDQGFSFDFD